MEEEQRTPQESELVRELSRQPPERDEKKNAMTRFYKFADRLYHSLNFRLGLDLTLSAALSITIGSSLYRGALEQNVVNPNYVGISIGVGVFSFFLCSIVSALRHSDRYDQWNLESSSKWH